MIYARPPIPGQVKTRMQPRLGPDQAAQLYTAMLCDLIERARAALAGVADCIISWSGPHTPQEELADLARGMASATQQGDDLGERMGRSLQETFQQGRRRVVIIGSDSPTLPSSYLHRALDALTRADIVLGPAMDGGYYLMGARRLHLTLLRGIPWSTPRVLELTRRRIRKEAIPCEELPPWHDVDTWEDVVRLSEELDHMKAKRSPDLPRRTLAVVTGLQRAGLLS